MQWSEVLAGAELPVLMGIVNVTPDSFSDGGLFLSPGAAVEHGLRLAAEGASLLDVGGESTRPPVYGAAEDVPAGTEIERVVPVIAALAREAGIPVSVDTRKAAVAEAALGAGATIVNDVTALRYDAGLGGVVARRGAGAILMHMRGTDPRTMQDDIAYSDPVEEIALELSQAVERGRDAGVEPERIAVDPGLGFGKTGAHNLLLVARLARFAALGFPVVVGASRKGFTARFSGVPSEAPPIGRLGGSLACAAAAARSGASIVRVHDVAATARFLGALRAGVPAPEAAGDAGASPAAYAEMERAILGALEGRE